MSRNVPCSYPVEIEFWQADKVACVTGWGYERSDRHSLRKRHGQWP
ncbi:hypothetical protein [Streptomyces sp. NPDC087856]